MLVTHTPLVTGPAAGCDRGLFIPDSENISFSRLKQYYLERLGPLLIAANYKARGANGRKAIISIPLQDFGRFDGGNLVQQDSGETMPLSLAFEQILKEMIAEDLVGLDNIAAVMLDYEPHPLDPPAIAQHSFEEIGSTGIFFFRNSSYPMELRTGAGGSHFFTGYYGAGMLAEADKHLSGHFKEAMVFAVVSGGHVAIPIGGRSLAIDYTSAANTICRRLGQFDPESLLYRPQTGETWQAFSDQQRVQMSCQNIIRDNWSISSFRHSTYRPEECFLFHQRRTFDLSSEEVATTERQTQRLFDKSVPEGDDTQELREGECTVKCTIS